MSDLLSNPSIKIAEALEKKLRNLEKRRSKLQQVKSDMDNGNKLTEIQLEAVSKLGEVELQIEYVKEMAKLVQQQQKQYLRLKKLAQDTQDKANREAENANIKNYLQYLEVLKLCGKVDLKTLLKENSELNFAADELNTLEKVGRKICISLDQSDNVEEWNERINYVAHLLKQINVTSQSTLETDLTGGHLKDSITRFVDSKLFKSFRFSTTVNNLTTDKGNTEETSLNDFLQKTAVVNVETPKSEINVCTDASTKKDLVAQNVSPNAPSNSSSDEGFVVVNVLSNAKNETNDSTKINEFNSIEEQKKSSAAVFNENYVEAFGTKNVENLTNSNDNGHDVKNVAVVETNEVTFVNENLSNAPNTLHQRKDHGYHRNRFQQNFRRGPLSMGNSRSDKPPVKNSAGGKPVFRKTRPRFNNSQNEGDCENHLAEHDTEQQSPRDGNKSATVENSGFVRAVNSKRRNYEINTGFSNRNIGNNRYRENHQNSDINSGGQKFNNVENGNFNNGDHGRNGKFNGNGYGNRGQRFSNGNTGQQYCRNESNGASEERKLRYRQNYECGFRFAV